MLTYNYRKGLIVMVLALMATLSLGFADTSVTADVTSVEVTSADLSDEVYSLSEIIDLTIANDLDIARYKTKIMEANVNYTDAKADAEDIKWDYKDVEAYESLLMEYHYTPFELKKTIDSLNLEYLKYVEDLKYEVKSLYFDILSSNDSISLQTDQVGYYKDILSEVEKKYELGMATELDVKLAEYDVFSAELTLQSLENHADSLNRSLLSKMGLDEDAIVTLEPSNMSISYYYNLTDTIKNLTETDYDIKMAKIDYDLAYKKDEVARMSFEDRTESGLGVYVNEYDEPSDYKDIKSDMEDKLVAYNRLVRTRKIDIYVAYNDLETSRAANNISRINYDAALRSFNTIQVQYDLEMITETAFLQGKISLQQAKQNYEVSKMDLYLAIQNFDSLIQSYK